MECPELEFLDISLTKDSSLLLDVYSPFYLRILKKTNSTLVLKILTKKSAKQENESPHEYHFLQQKTENLTKTQVWEV